MKVLQQGGTIVLSSFLEDLDLFILKCSRIKNIPIFFFTDWKWSIYFKFKRFITLNFSNSYNMVNLRDFDSTIKNLQDKFIIGPVDKASNNFSFMCKKLLSPTY